MVIAQATGARMQPINWQGMTANLGPVVRILQQREADERAGITLSTSDVRMLVNEIRQLGALVTWAREQARLAHMALLENDVALADEFARRVADDPDLTPAGYK